MSAALSLQGSELFLANVGDSRAVLGTRVGGRMEAQQLTQDFKPDLPSKHKVNRTQVAPIGWSLLLGG